MKVVFLDIDGVLNSHDWWYARTSDRHDIDPRNVAVLNEITQPVAASIVVSSTWRLHYRGRYQDHDGERPTWRFLGDLLHSHGVLAPIIGITEQLPAVPDGKGGRKSCPRGLEIRAWLEAHAGVTHFVVLDDDMDMDGVEDHHVKTDMRTGGLRRAHVAPALSLLGGSDVPAA